MPLSLTSLACTAYDHQQEPVHNRQLANLAPFDQSCLFHGEGNDIFARGGDNRSLFGIVTGVEFGGREI